jgi:putative transposase
MGLTGGCYQAKGVKQMSVFTKEHCKEIINAYGIQTAEDVEHAVKDLMKDVLQSALDAELGETLGYEKYERPENGTQNSRNGHYKKTVKSSHGPIELDIPRDRSGQYEPSVIKKGQSSISGIEERIIAMYARGMSTRDIHDHMHEIYGVEVSAEMVSKITDKLLPKIRDWQARQLQSIYPIIYLDAIQFSVKEDGKTVKKSIYIAMGIDAEGMKDVLGIWVGGNESSKYWLSVLTELKNRGLSDILICCVDGLTGFDQAIEAIFPKTEIQRCIVHQIRNACKFVSYKDRKEFCADMKFIYAAPTEDAGLEALLEFDRKWGKQYGYAVKSWENNWPNLSTFFKFPDEIRRLIYTTNPIESLNSCIRKTTTPKRVFPTDDSVLKSVFLAVETRVKKWTTRTKDWHIIWGQLTIYFQERLEGVINQ